MLYYLNYLIHYPFQTSNLVKAMKYSTIIKGKRFRPCLVYIVREMLQVNLMTLDTIAAAIECIHSYSLIHDDLPCIDNIDNDDYRRGDLTCHKKYGESVSLIAGDALQSLAFNILSTFSMPGVLDCNRIKMISDLSVSIGSSGMCIGQLMDLEQDKKIKKFKYEQINLYKTGFLIRSSVRLPYLSLNHDPDIFSILDCFSSTLGIAFQIQDDIVDYMEDSIQHSKKNIKKKIFQQNNVVSNKNISEYKTKLSKLYHNLLFLLNMLKNKNYDITKLKILTHYIIKHHKDF